MEIIGLKASSYTWLANLLHSPLLWLWCLASSGRGPEWGGARVGTLPQPLQARMAKAGVERQGGSTRLEGEVVVEEENTTATEAMLPLLHLSHMLLLLTQGGWLRRGRPQSHHLKAGQRGDVSFLKEQWGWCFGFFCFPQLEEKSKQNFHSPSHFGRKFPIFILFNWSSENTLP